MATKTPKTPKTLDPLTTLTPAQAFKYPLPQVRTFHHTLTTSLDEKNSRLRTLVGGSYRELLGTAELILKMRGEIEGVEERLGRVGRGCGRGVLGKKVGGLGKLERGEEGDGAKVGIENGKGDMELGIVAKGKVLGICAIVVGRLLRRASTSYTDTNTNGNINSERKEGAEDKVEKASSLLLAAKVLVLSRLLSKSLTSSLSLTTSTSPSNPIKDQTLSLSETRKKLATLKKRLLSIVKRTLERTDGDPSREDLVKTLAAYSLAESAGAKDVLVHFLRIRGMALGRAFDDEEGVGGQGEVKGVVRALKLYTKTLLDVQALVPRRLSEALAGLKGKPLLKDEKVREIEGLRLDVCERWFGDEITFFIPYIRHDDLDGPVAVETLRGWAKQASEVLLQGLGKALQRMTEFKTVVESRTRILEIWIKDGGRAKGFDPSILLDGLREVVSDRLVQLIDSRVGKLHLVATEIEATLSSWQEGVSNKHSSLWDKEILEMEISHGAIPFKNSILALTHGRSDAISRTFGSYQTWHSLMSEIGSVITQLKAQRWDDDLEDIEDDLALESRNTLLSVDDPKILQEKLDGSLEAAYSSLHEKISSLLKEHEESGQMGAVSIFTLRVIRDIRSSLPPQKSVQGFGLSLIPTLHQRLISTVSCDPLTVFEKGLKGEKKVKGRTLWEGEPELPVQPSTGTFRLLKGVKGQMAGVGGDVWSAVAVGVLKKHLRSELGEKWAEALTSLKEEGEGKEVEKSNGTTTTAEASSDETETDPNESTEEVQPKDTENSLSNEPIKKDILIQSLFDICLLQHTLELPSYTEDDKFNKLQGLVEERLEEEVGDGDGVKFGERERKRIREGAGEYWKRVGLLFGFVC